MSRPDTRRGFSLVELAVALTLLFIVLGLPAMILRTSSRAYSTGTSNGEIDLSTRRALHSIGERLSATAVDRIPAAAAGPGVPHDTVTYQVNTGFVAGAATWSADERIELRPEPGEAVDGADNDGDGLIDEHRIVLIRDLGLPTESTRVLCTRVARSLQGEVPGNGADDNGNGFVDEGGLMIAFDGERVLVALTVQRRDSFGSTVVQTSQRTVALRN